MAQAKKDSHQEQLLIRIITFVILVPTIALLALHPALRIPFDLFVTSAMIVAGSEYHRMVRAKGMPARRWSVLAGVAVVAVAAHFGISMAGFTMVVLALFVFHLYRRPPTISEVTTEMFGVLYIGLLGSYVIRLRALPYGTGQIAILFMSVWLTDTGAYLTGTGFGRWKLSPRLSPRKTVEGAVGGLLFAVVGAVLLKQVELTGKLAMPPYTMSQYVVVAALASILGQVGDMFESAMKRDTNIKDTGSLFPGHGGLLDRCDSVLFAAPVVYYYAELVLK